MSVIRRIIKFKKHDWQHVLWLSGLALRNFILMEDFDELKLQLFFLKLHFTCDSQLIEKRDDSNAT